MSKDTIALFGAFTFLLVCLALSLWGKPWRKRQPPLRHEPFIVAEPDPPEIARFSDDFAEYYVLCVQENEFMTFKDAIVLYLEEEFLTK